MRIKDTFWDWIDFSQEIKKWFLESLKQGSIDSARKIKNDLWDWIDFSQEIKECEKIMKTWFLENLKRRYLLSKRSKK
jgi:hypothetical protein